MKKISSTKAKKTETSEQGDAHFKVVSPKPLSRNRRELDGATEPEGRRQGHNPRPDGLVWELSSMKEDAAHWLEGPEYGALRHRLEIVHAAAEAALVEARRRVRLDEGWER